jgi:hypothetical protein
VTEKFSREIVLPGLRSASWNDFWSCPHWSERQREANRVKGIVRSAIDPELPGVPVPCDIEVIVYFDSRAQDSDNILAKPIIDAFKGWWIPDDTSAFVRRVTVESHKDKDNPRVVVRFTSLPGAKQWDEKEPKVSSVERDV